MITCNEKLEQQKGTTKIYYVFGAYSTEKNICAYAYTAISNGKTEQKTACIEGSSAKMTQAAILNGILAALEDANQNGTTKIIISHQLKDFDKLYNGNTDTVIREIRNAIPKTMCVQFIYIDDADIPLSAKTCKLLAQKTADFADDKVDVSPRELRHEKIARLSKALQGLQQIEDEISISDKILQSLDGKKDVKITEDEFGIICKAVQEYRTKLDALSSPIEN